MLEPFFFRNDLTGHGTPRLSGEFSLGGFVTLGTAGWPKSPGLWRKLLICAKDPRGEFLPTCEWAKPEVHSLSHLCIIYMLLQKQVETWIDMISLFCKMTPLTDFWRFTLWWSWLTLFSTPFWESYWQRGLETYWNMQPFATLQRIEAAPWLMRKDSAKSCQFWCGVVECFGRSQLDPTCVRPISHPTSLWPEEPTEGLLESMTSSHHIEAWSYHTRKTQWHILAHRLTCRICSIWYHMIFALASSSISYDTTW